MSAAGLRYVDWFGLSGGIVTIHVGTVAWSQRPPGPSGAGERRARCAGSSGGARLGDRLGCDLAPLGRQLGGERIADRCGLRARLPGEEIS